MATHTEMKRIAEDASAVRRMAALLLTSTDHDWTDWELDFLEHMSHFEGPEPITMRQREVLFELRDRAELSREWRGIPVRRLIDQCWQARHDLDEDDEAFIAGLHDRRPSALRRGSLRRLVRSAIQLGVIEQHMAPIDYARPAAFEANPN